MRNSRSGGRPVAPGYLAGRRHGSAPPRRPRFLPQPPAARIGSEERKRQGRNKGEWRKTTKESASLDLIRSAPLTAAAAAGDKQRTDTYCS
jgi:hypothetical protein